MASPSPSGSTASSAQDVDKLFQAAIDRSRQQREDSSGGGGSGGSNLQMTPQEQATFFQAMQKPEFRALLNDYMQEISDPANREETEKYLAQLEQDNQLPKDKILISPEPHFVVKSRFHKATAPAKQKIFINCCSHEQIQPPSSTRVRQTDSSSKGTSWRLPYSLGPERFELDNSGSQVRTFDACYHPRTLQFANSSGAFKKMLVNTSLEAVESALRKNYNDQSIQLERAFHVLKGIRYKSGKPVTMCLRKQQVEEQAAQREESVNTSTSVPTSTAKKTSSSSPSPSQGTTKAKEPSQQPAKVHSQPSANTMSLKASSGLVAEPTSDKKVLIEEIPARTPAKPLLKTFTYQVIHRGKFEMTDHMQHSGVRSAFRPKELVVRIPLPGHHNASGVELDVATNELKLQSKGYSSLNLPLAFPVVEDKGHAKFDKSKQELVVTLPVQPPAPSPIDPAPSTEPQVHPKQEEEDQEEEQEQEEDSAMENEEANQEEASVVEKVTEVLPSETKAIHPVVRPCTSRLDRGNQEDEFLPLREFAEMAMHDPLRMKQMQHQHQHQQQEEKLLGDQEESWHSSNNQQENDVAVDEYADLPELESATSEEEIEEEENEEEHQRMDMQQQQENEQLAQEESSAQVPSFSINQSSKCLTFVIEQASIQESSVVLDVSADHMSVQFSTRAESNVGMRSFQLCRHFKTPRIDPERREFHVASKNMVVVLYKANSHQGLWSKDELFQVEHQEAQALKKNPHASGEPEQEGEEDNEQVQQELEKEALADLSMELLSVDQPKCFRNELIYELD